VPSNTPFLFDFQGFTGQMGGGTTQPEATPEPGAGG
jgi:hypothetical protein